MTTPKNNNEGILWKEELRKLGGEQLVNLFIEIREGQQRMDDRMDNMEAGITEAIERHVKIAFAGGDADGHRRAHEAMIQMMEERRQFYASIKEKTISGLLWGAMVWAGYATLAQVRHSLGIVP